MASCLVTGGAGFIGSHITDGLIDSGYNVTVVDNLSKGKKENINSKASFICLDICDSGLDDVFARNNFDYVFHLAAQTSVQRSLTDPQQDAATNIVGTINLLEASRKNRIKKVVYSSSASVYGEPDFVPLDENHQLNPCSAYGLSKQVAEQYLELFNLLYSLDFTALRYANVYGPRQDSSAEGGVVAIFADQVASGQVPVIYGDGEQTRDFIYIKDVVDANLCAMNRGSGQILNIGTGVATSINNLHSHLTAAAGSTSFPDYRPAKPGDIRHSYLDITQARNALAWNPGIDLQTGLNLTLKGR